MQRPFLGSLFTMAALLAGSSMLSLATAGTTLAQEAKPPSNKPAPLPTAMQILEWLPADTETFLVAHGPFQLPRVPAEDDKDAAEKLTLAQMLQGTACWPLMARDSLLVKTLAGQNIALAMEGARGFRQNKGLGMALYDGIHILVFPHDLGTVGDAISKALADAGAKRQRIAGRQVLMVEEKYENDIWKFYFAQPKPNVLVGATDAGYLAEVFQRMDKPQAKRALPKELAEWKYVDTTASFWAMRHWDDAIKGAGGLVFSYSPDESPNKNRPATIKMLWPNTNLRRAKDAWTYVGEATWKPEVKQLAPGVIEVTARLRKNADAGRFFYVLLAHLGHAISV
jgi:hypothetical protein